MASGIENPTPDDELLRRVREEGCDHRGPLWMHT
jgi:hypothetical protein